MSSVTTRKLSVVDPTETGEMTKVPQVLGKKASPPHSPSSRTITKSSSNLLNDLLQGAGTLDPTETGEMTKVPQVLGNKGSPKASPRSSRVFVRLDSESFKSAVSSSEEQKNSILQITEATSPVLGKGHRSNSTTGTKV